MPKPSNQSLLADKKAIAAIVDVEAGESTADAVARALAEKDAEIAKMKGLLKTTADALVEAESARVTSDTPPLEMAGGPTPERQIGPHRGMPVDTAIYLQPGQTLPDPPPGTLTAQRGDMGESYIRWLLTTGGPDAIREKYGPRMVEGPGGAAAPKVRLESRFHLLPIDIQNAIK